MHTSDTLKTIPTCHDIFQRFGAVANSDNVSNFQLSAVFHQAGLGLLVILEQNPKTLAKEMWLS